ncbi:MAG: methyltransferase domain-containing protein [Acidobacteria bacterium]|nr:methyltransferase domain-containing protein [Acidobacteriota bacterium]
MTDATRRAFDAVAETYDADFTDSHIGRLQRGQLRRIYDRLFAPGMRLLDLGCGTGEDALAFAADGCEVEGVDVSPAMVELARRRAADAGLEERAAFLALPLERLDELPERGFQGAYSSFSPLSCVRELAPVARALADRMEPDAPLALCLMSRWCLWETVLYPFTARLHEAAGRELGGWVRASAASHEVALYYHGVREVKRAFAPWFRLEGAQGLGVFTPPTYLEPWARRRQRLLGGLAWLDERLAALPLVRSLAEHRVMVLRRTPD